MLNLLLTIVISFFISSLFGYLVHWSLHQPWAKVLYRKHMTHHLSLYPPSDYTSTSYRDAGKDNTIFTFAVLSIPLILIPIVLGFCNILNWHSIMITILVMGIMAFLHDYLHDSFHIKDHPLTKMKYTKSVFNYWNKIHYIHHVDMSKNYGIFMFHWDYVFRTFKRQE